MVALGIRPARRLRPLAVFAASALALALLVLPASPAQAHDELLGSSPAAGASVEGLPAELTLTFSGAIATDPGASEVAVTDAAGTSLVDEAASAQDNVLTQPLAGEASGAVTVLWKVVSSDGHPISGEFTFTVSAAPAPTETVSPTPSETAEPAPTPSPSELTDDMAVDGGATLLANMLPVLIGAAILGAAVVAILLAVRRRRPPSSPSGPDSEPPAER